MKAKNFIAGAYRRLNRVLRNFHYILLSRNVNVFGQPIKHQPVLLMGAGPISFGRNVRVGVRSSPNYWSSYCYLESRSPDSSIHIGENTWINNNFAAIAEKCSIEIGAYCLIGHDVLIIDSNFHDLNPANRHNRGNVEVGSVKIADNVFIGSRVVILKNSSVGSGSVIAAGAIVSGTFPSNCLIGGNPAAIIRHL
jgi:acetyltransferase-like isoleucine patch superfamily enzyme